jgi:hypothetical protein
MVSTAGATLLEQEQQQLRLWTMYRSCCLQLISVRFSVWLERWGVANVQQR